MEWVALHPTLMAKNSSKKTIMMDWESDNALESGGSAGPPSLTSTSSDDDEKYTYRQKNVEEETAKEQRTKFNQLHKIENPGWSAAWFNLRCYSRRTVSGYS